MMRIAVTYDILSKKVFPHFGETKNFLLVDVEGDQREERVVTNGGFSHKALTDYLAGLHVDVLLCGGMGHHAIEFLEGYGIEVVPGVTGLAFEAVNSYLAGTLKGDKNAIHVCSHS